MVIIAFIVLIYDWQIGNIWKSSSWLEVSIPVAESHHNVSADWCLIPAPWGISKENCSNLRCPLERFPVASARLRIHLKVWWPVRMVELVFSSYGQSNITAHTKARNTRWVVSSFLLALFKVCDQYPMFFVTQSSSVCRNTKPSCR